ncbi:hypothetical protein [Naasia lichenicola]|nr:hypothetical protein [Naasia lichenicola]
MENERTAEIATRLSEVEQLPLAERADGYGQLLDALRTELEAAPADS